MPLLLGGGHTQNTMFLSNFGSCPAEGPVGVSISKKNTTRSHNRHLTNKSLCNVTTTKKQIWLYMNSTILSTESLWSYTSNIDLQSNATLPEEIAGFLRCYQPPWSLKNPLIRPYFLWHWGSTLHFPWYNSHRFKQVFLKWKGRNHDLQVITSMTKNSWRRT